MRVPGGGAPFAIAGSASRPSRDAPTRAAPAPFRNPRLVVLASSSAIRATASSTEFASVVRAKFPTSLVLDDQLNDCARFRVALQPGPATRARRAARSG